MKLSASITAFFLLCATVSLAQNGRSPEARAKTETLWMQDSLGLKPGQTAKVSKINIDYNKDMDKTAQIKDDIKKAGKQEKLKRKRRAEMKAVLSRDQYPIYFRHEKELRHTDRQNLQNEKEAGNE